jgi:hypothetical protein
MHRNIFFTFSIVISLNQITFFIRLRRDFSIGANSDMV